MLETYELEALLIDILESAENEWDLLGRQSAAAIVAVSLLRKLRSMLSNGL